MKAYMFINVAPRKSSEVVSQLRSIGGVRSADTCWGLPDIIALVEAADMEGLQELVLDKIQKVAGINQTETHIFLQG